MNDNFDKVLDSLVQSTRSPKGAYSKERTWMKLEARRKAEVRRHSFVIWRRVSSVAAVFFICLLGWATYHQLIVEPRSSQPSVEIPAHEKQPSTMVFKQETLQNIVDVLTQTYHRPIIIEDETLKNYRITATFRSDESLDEILNLLQKASAFTYTNANDTIIIKTGRIYETN